jgi:hypothetical protein
MRPFSFFESLASLIVQAVIYSRDLSRPPQRRAIKSRAALFGYHQPSGVHRTSERGFFGSH